MEESSTSLRWLLLGSVICVLTPTVLHLWNSMWGRLYSGFHSWLFQVVAGRFDISEHRFENVGNIASVTKILRQLGLRTHRHVWHHDANADTGDSLQVGTIRLPTQSWLLWTLALLDITRYIGGEG